MVVKEVFNRTTLLTLVKTEASVEVVVAVVIQEAEQVMTMVLTKKAGVAVVVPLILVQTRVMPLVLIPATAR